MNRFESNPKTGAVLSDAPTGFFPIFLENRKSFCCKLIFCCRPIIGTFVHEKSF